MILEHGLNGFDGFIYASLFIRVVTSVVAQVIRSIRGRYFFKQESILDHGLNGFDGFIYASLFIRAATSVVAQVIRIIRSIRVPFYPFLPRGHSGHPHNPFNPWSFLSLFAPWSFFHRVYFLRQMGRG